MLWNSVLTWKIQTGEVEKHIIITIHTYLLRFFSTSSSRILQKIVSEFSRKSSWVHLINGILLPKLFWPTVRKNCSSDREKLFAKFLRSLEQFIQTVKGRKNFCFTECFSNLFVEVSHIKRIRTIQIQIGRNYWDLETCSKCFLFAYKVRKIPKWITQ